jgi:hypothetical protein
MGVPAEFRPLFWDVRPEEIDPDAHAPFVLERLLEYGSLAAVRWTLRAYGRDRIADFLRGRGRRTLSRKTLAFWTLILGLEGEECFQTSSLRCSRPLWDY